PLQTLPSAFHRHGRAFLASAARRAPASAVQTTPRGVAIHQCLCPATHVNRDAPAPDISGGWGGYRGSCPAAPSSTPTPLTGFSGSLVGAAGPSQYLGPEDTSMSFGSAGAGCAACGPGPALR